MIVPVILSGGSGSRLWPLSRKLYPKQFLNLVSENSLFQDTILRLPKNTSNPLVICNEEHRFLVAEQLRQINSDNLGILLEPEGRSTAPAIALAAIHLLNNNHDPVLLTLSSDHSISKIENFHSAIEIANKVAENGKMVALGVKPEGPETGYGYIEVNTSLNSDFHRIFSFKEKPSLKIAKDYFNSGKHFWNCGIFLFKASTFLSELKKYEPEIYKYCSNSCETKQIDLDFIRIDNNEFLKCPSKSIDFGIMEKTKNGIVVPFEGGWRDIGSWESLWSSKPKDSNNNYTQGDVTTNNVSNSFILSSNRLISVNDISDIIVIDTQDALMLANKKKSQNVKQIFQKLRDSNRNECDNHRKVYRPWGYYDSIDSGKGFQVKRILVKPGAKLSLQKHKKRAEHWVVIKGVASIICGKKSFKLHKNESTFIPKGEVHRLENNENKPLEIIEIQTGKYLGEDDIVRLDDYYKRN